MREFASFDLRFLGHGEMDQQPRRKYLVVASCLVSRLQISTKNKEETELLLQDVDF